MAITITISISTFVVCIVLLISSKFVASVSSPLCQSGYPNNAVPVHNEDIDLMQFAGNVEFLEAEFFCWGSYGYGLDVLEPGLVDGGPPPKGVTKANLDFLTRNIFKEFCNQEIGHLRAIRSRVGLFERPLLDLSTKNFAQLFDEAFGCKLEPPFDPYRDSLSYMLASYAIPYVGLVAYVGTNPNINGYITKRGVSQLLEGLLGVEAGQDAVIRQYLYERASHVVFPYRHTVADFTIRISVLRNRLALCGIKDEGLLVPPFLGAENRTTSNVLSADNESLSYKRTPAEILRILYTTSDEHIPGGFLPLGGNGRIARDFLIE
nr:desiccation-related protein PCC13-62-like [Ipomoea batatas]